MNWSYIAGFFDGEGTFSIYYDKNNKIKYQISISQTSTKVLEEIQKHIGFGKIYKCDSTGNKNWNKKWRVAYALKINKRSDILFFIPGTP